MDGMRITKALDFAREHSQDDTHKLLLGRDKYPMVDVSLAVSTILARRRLSAKLPEWASRDDLIFPDSLCTEQCSGSLTSTFKANLAFSLIRERSSALLADLTGGLGADSAAFASLFREVLYNERNPELWEAARHNLEILAPGKFRFSCKSLDRDSLDGILGDFAPDIIFLDPARRSSGGSKVFRLTDCSPDVLSLKEDLLARAPLLMLKLSPMVDLSLLSSDLGRELKSIHILGADGECKEIIAVLESGGDFDEPLISVADSGSTLHFSPSGEKSAVPVYSASETVGRLLLEPGKALMKSGAFKTVSERFGLEKIAPSTHLYLCDTLPEGIDGLFKVFTVIDVLPLNKDGMKEAARRYPDADVTARNIPLSSEELKKKMGIRHSGGAHIFAVQTLSGEKILTVCQSSRQRVQKS